MQEIDWDSTLEGLILFQSWSVFAEEKFVELTEKVKPVSRTKDDGNMKNPLVTRTFLEAVRKKHTKWLKYKY